MSTAVSKIALSAELSDNKLVWLAPAFAAFAYPYFVMQFYQSGRMLHQASDPSSRAVQGEHIDLHGNNDTKDVYLANRQQAAATL